MPDEQADNAVLVVNAVQTEVDGLVRELFKYVVQHGFTPEQIEFMAQRLNDNTNFHRCY